MNRRYLVLIAAAAATLAAGPNRAHALSGCAANLLNGSYAMQFAGAGTSGRLSGLARLTFDAEGNVQGYSTVNASGSWQKRDVSGTYIVNDDCTATFSITDTSGTTQNYSGVIAAQGDSLLAIQTDPGVQISASLSRVRNFCHASDLAGSFGLQYQAVLSDPAQAPFSSVGLVNIDADGNVLASELRSGAGAYSQVASAGSIVVETDCTASLTLTPLSGTAAPVTFQGMVSASGRSVLLVGVEGGKQVTGAITAQ